MNWPPSRTSRNRASSSETSGAYCDWTSTSGIVTATHSSGGCPSIHEIRRRQENACHDRVLGVVKAVVEALEARSERVADASEHERPDGAADAEVEQERGEPQLEDAGGDRAEGADEGRHRAEEHGEVPPALERALGVVEPLRCDVQPAAPPLEQRPAPAAADEPADDAPGEVAERAGERDHDEGPDPEADLRAEERDPVRAGEDAAGDGAAVEHDELARRREDGADRKQDEHRVGPLRRDVRL